MNQFTLKCKQHSNRIITNIYVKEQCPQSSRLACVKCLMEQEKINKFEGYIDIIDFLEDPVNILSVSNRNMGIFDQLNSYFQKATKNPFQIIQDYIQKMNELIEQFKKDLAQHIDEFSDFQNLIKKGKTQFVEAVGHSNLVEQFREIDQIQNYHEQKEWIQLEQSIDDYLQQFFYQDNQELKETLHNIKQTDKNFFPSQVFTNFNKTSQSLFGQMYQELMKLGCKSHLLSNTLCDNEFNFQLLQQIDSNFRIKATLIFKGSEHGLNSISFWNKCKNQGPTLTICKSSTGSVFGGYSPCKWIPNNQYQADQSLKSFLFNFNRKEFYPLTNPAYSIYGKREQGPTFGQGHDLYLGSDFKVGCSNLGYSYKVNNNQVQNLNFKTYLTGSEQVGLVEMEVYLIEPF